MLNSLALPVSADTSFPCTHYNPVVLNECAITEVMAGEASTALLLLERAVRLAPSDERIFLNLQQLRSHVDAPPLPDYYPREPQPLAAEEIAVVPLSPSLWKMK